MNRGPLDLAIAEEAFEASHRVPTRAASVAKTEDRKPSTRNPPQAQNNRRPKPRGWALARTPCLRSRIPATPPASTFGRLSLNLRLVSPRSDRTTRHAGPFSLPNWRSGSRRAVSRPRAPRSAPPPSQAAASRSIRPATRSTGVGDHACRTGEGKCNGDAKRAPKRTIRPNISAAGPDAAGPAVCPRSPDAAIPQGKADECPPKPASPTARRRDDSCDPPIGRSTAAAGNRSPARHRNATSLRTGLASLLSRVAANDVRRAGHGAVGCVNAVSSMRLRRRSGSRRECSRSMPIHACATAHGTAFRNRLQPIRRRRRRTGPTGLSCSEVKEFSSGVRLRSRLAVASSMRNQNERRSRTTQPRSGRADSAGRGGRRPTRAGPERSPRTLPPILRAVAASVQPPLPCSRRFRAAAASA